MQPPLIPRDLRIVLSHAARTLLFVATVSLPVLLLYLDIHWLRDGVGEWSLVELTQEGILLATTLAFARLARRSQVDRPFALLAAGMFACMLLRELDALWDLAFHGAWLPLAIMVALASAVAAARDWRGALAGLARFVSSRSGAVMTLGLVVVLVYSRLFGVAALWQGLLGEQYVRVLKNAAEESVELLGYTFVLWSAVVYAAQRSRRRRTSPAGRTGAQAYAPARQWRGR